MMGRTDESSRGTRRRFLVVAGTLATAGCLDGVADDTDGADTPTETGLQTPASDGTDEQTDEAQTPTSTPVPETHPFAGRTASVIIEQVEEDRERLERLLRKAISFWNDNQSEYLSYSTTLEHRPDAEEPDVTVSEVPSIDSCGLHDEGEFAGCATRLSEGDGAALPAEVRLDPAANDWRYRNTIKHELGHVLGLGHDDAPANIMGDSLDERYPEYEQRKEILEVRDEWVSEYNSATKELTAGFDAVDADDFETATGAFDTARQHYETAADLIETATELATELSRFEPADREKLDEMLDSEASFAASMQSAVDLLHDGAERIASGEDGYDTYNEGVDAYNETIEQPLPETSEYVAAVGLVHIQVETSGNE
jgi:hypothetical protein